MNRFSLSIVLAACACGEYGGAAALPDVAEPYRGPAASAPTNRIQVLASAVSEVVTDTDSILVRYRVRNDGPATEFRDTEEYYFFTTYRPDGSPAPSTPAEQANVERGGPPWRSLAPGATTPERVVNLACFRREEEPSGPCSGLRLRDPGDYYIVVQHAPIRPPAGSDQDGEIFLPSRADTVLIRFRPRR